MLVASELILALIVGLFVGLASVFLGVGGGIIVVPALPLIAPIEPRSIIGTSLCVVFAISVQNAIAFHKRGLIDWKAGSLIGAFSAVGSFLAGRATAFVSPTILSISFAILLFSIGLLTIARARKNSANTHDENRKIPLVFVGIFGFFTGFISGFTGVGGGLLVVPVLSMLSWTPQNKVVPTSVATIVFTAGFGALSFLTENPQATVNSNSFGLVRIDLAAALFLGGLAISLVLHHKKATLNPRKRDWLVGVLLLALSIRTLFNSF